MHGWEFQLNGVNCWERHLTQQAFPTKNVRRIIEEALSLQEAIFTIRARKENQSKISKRYETD